MAGLNKVMIIGNLGADPEMRYTADGNALTSFRVAASRNYTTPDGQKRYRAEVVADRVLFLDRPGGAPLPEEHEAMEPAEHIEAEEIPFE